MGAEPSPSCPRPCRPCSSSRQATGAAHRSPAELAAAVGLGGRDRRAASDAERARLAVTQRVKAAIKRISGLHPGLGRHLGMSVKTGTFCVYTPDPAHPICWSR
jgi:hypothetical protein